MHHCNRTLTALAILVALCLSAFTAGCAKKVDKGQAVMPSDGQFRIDVSGMKGGEVRFFRYHANGKTVLFMVAKTVEGDIKTAFDACITCYPYKMGYIHEAGRVVCVKCGTAFDLEELGVGKGNCVPIQIEHSLQDSIVLIDRSIIESGSKWF